MKPAPAYRRRPPAPPPAPLPASFRLRFDPGVHRPAPTVLVGGAPLRVLRLSPRGAALVEQWMAGAPVGPGRAAGVLAARLVEAGMAQPCPPPGTPGPTVAVVIPVRDDQAGLDATAAALGLDATAAALGLDPTAAAPGPATSAPRETTPAPGPATCALVSVVVVDDGSLRPAAAWAGATVIRRARTGGPAAARNTGWKAAAGVDLVAFVDAGCAPDPGWLDILLPHFSDPAVAAVAPRIVTSVEAGTPARLAAYERAHSPLDLGATGAVVGPAGVVAYVPSTALVVRRADLVAADGFDESLRFGEDVDLVWRLRAGGRRVIYEPAATARHPARRTWAAWLAQRYRYGTSAAPLAARHGDAVAPLAASPWSVAAWGLVSGGHPLAAAGLTAAAAAALARRAGTTGADRPVAAELARLAVTGTLRSAGPLGRAVRRAWLPPAVVVAAAVWWRGGRRAKLRLAAAALAVLGGPGRSRSGPATLGGGPGPAGPSWAVAVLAGLADDLAYQAGVWAGVWRQRSLRALLPRW